MNTDLKSQKIAVLYGGTSSEREVSIKSGTAVYDALLRLGYDVMLIDAKDDVADALKANAITVAFVALHGGTGENGAIQGLLEVMGIAYTGSGVLASALAMNKVASKKIFKFHNLNLAPFVVLEKSKLQDLKNYQSQITCPAVVKPALEGSSIGVSVINSPDELMPALDEAFRYGDTAIVEKFISGKEIHIAVLNGQSLGGVEVRPKSGFYSYEAKYTKGMTDYILPPEIDEEAYLTLQADAVTAYNALGCKGACRVDFILSPEASKPFILEVNTIPGMTETSLLPKIAKLSGMEFTDLVQSMLMSAFV